MKAEGNQIPSEMLVYTSVFFHHLVVSKDCRKVSCFKNKMHRIYKPFALLLFSCLLALEFTSRPASNSSVSSPSQVEEHLDKTMMYMKMMR